MAKKNIQVEGQLEQAVEDVAQAQESLKCEITQVSDWNLIKEAILHAPPHSYIIFDINGVILEESTHEDLLDIEILNVVKLIKHKNLKAYALAHGGWGMYREGTHIICYEDFRINTIKELGIDFSQLSQFRGYLEIPYQTSSPFWFFKKSVKTALIKDGIIFARDRIYDTLDKGKIFFKVLEKLNEQPTHIIFIDDRIDNLESMKRECKSRHIPFQGFEYIYTYQSN